MTIDEIIRVLENEEACVMRQSAGKCDRDCAVCDLVLPDRHVLAAYREAVANLTQQKAKEFDPPCYRPDGDGCAYQCYDNDDEPIDKCKKCPLCNSDKQRVVGKDIHVLTSQEKNKPCEYCSENPLLIADNDELVAKITQVTPFPAINLSTGENETKADPPYYAIMVVHDDGEYSPMEDFVPIEYCPKCGRRLIATRTYESMIAGEKTQCTN